LVSDETSAGENEPPPSHPVVEVELSNTAYWTVMRFMSAVAIDLCCEG
jgi:hypothetical protein